MKWIVGGLCAAVLASPAIAANRFCEGSSVDWPGKMMVSLTVDEAGKPRSASARLHLGGDKAEFPIVQVEYDIATDSPTLGDITWLSVGAAVRRDQDPASTSATISVTVDSKEVWSRPWELYARQDRWTKGKGGNDPVALFGVVPLEARDSGLGAAMETGRFIVVSVRGVEFKETFGQRQFALARRKALQPMADKAFAEAMAKAADFETACEADKEPPSRKGAATPA